ncbi:MAG: divergent polysaccharide deacetylase family protein [Alphaproteobacteria bacterium]|nr:divergent polysaccharide deacetylase family protein [Alphaproteobacteria bacterium]
MALTAAMALSMVVWAGTAALRPTPLRPTTFQVASGPTPSQPLRLPPATELEPAIPLHPQADLDRPQRQHVNREFRSSTRPEGGVAESERPQRRIAALPPRALPEAGPPPESRAPAAVEQEPPDRRVPAWLRYAQPAPDHAGPIIAIVIDDAGLDRERLRRFTALPLRPLTIAFLPYAHDVAGQIDAARQLGHEILLHLPMEAEDSREDPGPNAILTRLPGEEIARRLLWNFDRLEGAGFVGVNNHMGSKATADAAVMAQVMAELRARGLLFLDSRTSTKSVAGRIADEYQVPHTKRDVFLDNDFHVDRVLERLAQTEDVARRHGYAIAIGHVQPWTLAALERWAPTLQAKGIALVPVSAIVRQVQEPGGLAALSGRAQRKHN